ncbi:hypothetical protein MTR67_026331 [Solanum verrucosum]|uniref:Uncharacterized protein n=1 Tax=Solanum verrucosum TaxID=315347 RepID=A0AAF0TUC9_SOLVR|nr:hypothetical protein MTR67_026331 [Solanum verrucosum]
MTKINRAWYTREHQVSPLNIGLTKEQLEKNQERDENMAKMMTQMDLLTKHVMGGGYKAMNVIDRGSCPSYPRLGGNQCWTKDHDSGWRDREHDWRDRVANWREMDGDRHGYVPPHDRPKPKEPNVDPKSF